MRLLCIKNGAWKEAKTRKPFKGKSPKWGKIVTVNKESDFGYFLDGYKRNLSFYKQYFIPLSNIDETERIDEVLFEMFVNKK